MNVYSFLKQYELAENPFAAEEARLDPVFAKLGRSNLQHPDFGKILGRIDKPSTAVVFGEKGSGKTAIRIDMEEQVADHNTKAQQGRVLSVSYDDQNPVLDALLRTRRVKDIDKALETIRLEDHQDAILSLAVTKWLDAVTGDRPPADVVLPEKSYKTLKKIPRQQRRDLATLALLYDKPRSGSPRERLASLSKTLRVGTFIHKELFFWKAMVLTALGVLFGLAYWLWSDTPRWVLAALILCGAGALLCWVVWLGKLWKPWNLGRRIAKEMPAVGRTAKELAAMLDGLSSATLAGQPIPLPLKDDEGPHDNRYQLTKRFLDVLAPFGYTGMIVMVDRVDEPTIVSGDPTRMRAIVWPMFDNKFLKQEGVGLKLLLPIELSYLLQKESPRFYQEARLDKQAMIDRLEWSGAMLYDLCASRLNACRPSTASPISLTDLFEQDVTREVLIDSLDQMHQPRDAFKFLYEVIQEHCKLMTQEAPKFSIARLTLENARRSQSQRVQELYRGLSPA
jgi:hypothetical protein